MRHIKIATTLLAAASIVIVLFVAIQSQAKYEGFKITGVVLDDQGNPVRNVTVTTWASDVPNGRILWSRTDERGHFSFPAVQPGKNWVCLALEGEKGGNLLSIAGTCRGEAYVVVNEINSSPDVVIVAQPSNPVIAGRIVDKATKRYEGGAEIKICLVSEPTRCSGVFGTLEDDGNFSMAVPTEPFTFTVSRGEKTFKLKQKNTEGADDEVLTFKAGEKRNVKISF